MLGTFTILGNGHCPLPALFHQDEQKLYTRWTITPHSPQFPAPWLLLLYFLSHLPILGTSYKWNHTIFVHLFLDYLSWHNISKVHPCGSVSERHSFLWLSNIPLYGYSSFVYPFTSWWMSGLFPPLDCCE